MSQKLKLLVLVTGLLHEISAFGIGTGIIEISPLRAVLGTPEFKVEVPVMANLNWSFGYQDLQIENAQMNKMDKSTAFDVSALFHSTAYLTKGLFLGPGLIWEENTNYRTQKSASRTWERQTSLETEDQWKIMRKALKIKQSVGYRVNFGEYNTGSIRVQLDKVVYTSNRVDQITINSDEVDEVVVESPTWSKTIAFYWGINIP